MTSGVHITKTKMCTPVYDDQVNRSLADFPKYRREKVDQNHIGPTFYLHGFHLAM
jgi:hypothetical protein